MKRYSELVSALYGEQEQLAVEAEITYQDGRKARLSTTLIIHTT
jgi:hypothetical protein